MANSLVVVALHSAWPNVVQLTLIAERCRLEALFYLERSYLVSKVHMLLYPVRKPIGLFLRSQVSNNFQRLSSNVRPNDNGSSRTAGGSNLICENCDFNGHTIDRCFKIIGYPPDFEAFITKIRNMPLTDYLTLFDVLVVPEYYDLKAGKVLGTGRQFGGLYYFDGNQDQVLNVLRPNLLFENNKSDVMCETCQRAKQTRESFPLIDHVSIELGKLVHLDLWGPYKITSSMLNAKSSIELIYKKKLPSLKHLRSEPRLNGYGTPSSHSGSTFDTHNENEGGHSLGSDATASKDDMSANPEDNINNNSEGNGPLFISQNDQDIFESHNLIRFSRPSIYPRNYNDFVVESQVNKPSYIPMQPNISLSTEPTDDDPLLDNVTDYQKLIGKLIYLTTTRPDIAYTVSCLSQFMHNPLKSHLKTALKVIMYIKGYPGKGVNVIKTSTHVNVLKAYTNIDWARCTNTRRSVTGYCVFINISLVSWKNKKQNTISKYSIKAECRALDSVTSVVVWVSKILKDLDCSNLLLVKVFCDNSSAIKSVVNFVFHERTKHLENDLHYVREKILDG
nr:ribonuclease H-like domain-containing protein [Tanacetum cinerariifolium]